MGARSLRLLYRSLVSSRIPATRARCPSVTGLRESFGPRMSSEAKDAIIDHISGCAECAREFEFIRAVAGHEDRLATAISRARDSRRPFLSVFARPVWAGILGGIILGLALSNVLVIRNGSPVEGPRSQARLPPEAIAPAGRVESRTFQIFRWKPVPEARSYVIEIYDESLRLLWESPTVTTAAVSVPESVKGRLAQGGVFYWSITAIMAENLINESGLQWFAVDR
jgi:hypothetical protein